MNDLFWTTIENQVREDGSKGLLYDHFDDYNDAIAKFHTVAAAAAKSGIPYHAIHILQSDGQIKKQEIFDRRPEPTPEPPTYEIDDAE